LSLAQAFALFAVKDHAVAKRALDWVWQNTAGTHGDDVAHGQEAHSACPELLEHAAVALLALEVPAQLQRTR